MKLTKDLVVFITGGASGLGEATVREIHASGCKIGVADMNEERLELLKNDLKENIVCIKCDVTKEEDVKRAIDETVKAFGTIHAALACAGVATVTPTLTSKGSLDIKLFKFT
jgi:3-hydroxyacyl-CoA dehydrogenase/3-hydroxy-2-methylbutyryl-CoA dehydrogenase